MEIFCVSVVVTQLYQRWILIQKGSFAFTEIHVSRHIDKDIEKTAREVLKENDYKLPIYCLLEYHGQLQTLIHFVMRNISRVLFNLSGHPSMMVTFDRELLVMPDGGTIALDWACKQKENTTVLTDSSPVILLCHGLVGDSQSEYIYHLSRRLMRAGYRAVVMVARGCGGLHLTSGGIFAGRRTSDIAACIHHIDDKYPQAKLFCVGFSLGAALTLQYLAEEHVPDSPKGSTFQGMSHWEAYAPVTAAVVVSPPWDIKTNSLVPRLIPSLWSYLLVVPLKVYFLLHYETLQRESPELYGKISLWNVLSCLTMADFERLCYNCHYRASGGTYGSIEAYYNDISPLHSAHYVHTPTVSLTSMDDPICMHEHCPSSTGSSSGGGGDGEEDEQSAATTNTIGPGLIVVKTPYGGHLAYPGGFFPITSAWTDRIIVEWFRQFL